MANVVVLSYNLNLELIIEKVLSKFHACVKVVGRPFSVESNVEVIMATSHQSLRASRISTLP